MTQLFDCVIIIITSSETLIDMAIRQNQRLRIRQQRLDIIATILARGVFTLSGISEALEKDYSIVTRNGKRLSSTSISRDLKVVDEMLLKRSVETHKTVKVRQQLKLEYLYREAVEAWVKSKQDKEVTTQESSSSGKARDIQRPEKDLDLPDNLKVSIRTEKQAGDPALLNAARSVLADITKLWGLNDPALIDIAVSQTPLVNSTSVHEAMTELKDWEQDIKAIEGEVKEVE